MNGKNINLILLVLLTITVLNAQGFIGEIVEGAGEIVEGAGRAAADVARGVGRGVRRVGEGVEETFTPERRVVVERTTEPVVVEQTVPTETIETAKVIETTPVRTVVYEEESFPEEEIEFEDDEDFE
jgi:hypothetical protein